MNNKNLDPELEERIINSMNISTFKPIKKEETISDTRKRVLNYIENNKVVFEKQKIPKTQPEGPWA